MDKEKIFSSEYVTESGTIIDIEKKLQNQDELKIECGKYGISKPARIVIRGKILHDKS